jgi:hypothetical protein
VGVVIAMSAVVVATVGGGWAVGNADPVVTSPEPAGPLAMPPDRTTQLSCQAQAALVSVHRQLEELDSTQRDWERLFGAEKPPEVQDLLMRKQVLEVQYAVLQSQVRAWQSIPRVQDELSKDQAHLASLDRALAAIRDRSPEQQAQARALSEQRDYWLEQRDAKQRDLERLVRVTEETADPLLAHSGSTTERLSGAVRALACGRMSPPPGRPEPGATTTGAAMESSETEATAGTAEEGYRQPR